MDFPNSELFQYIRSLHSEDDEPVLIEMEAHAAEQGFPIVGRVVGSCLELLTRAIGGKRVFELGSGFGFSGYWFARAVGERGEVFLTDGDAENAKKAEDYLSRAGYWDRCTFMVGDALDSLSGVEGEFDVVYCDIDKHEYPAAFAAARSRVRVGGLFICDNVLWSGRVAEQEHDAWTEAIVRQSRDVFADPDYRATIVPLRDGVLVALRIK